jgi:hypothetical protein
MSSNPAGKENVTPRRASTMADGVKRKFVMPGIHHCLLNPWCSFFFLEHISLLNVRLFPAYGTSYSSTVPNFFGLPLDRS